MRSSVRHYCIHVYIYLRIWLIYTKEKQWSFELFNWKISNWIIYTAHNYNTDTWFYAKYKRDQIHSKIFLYLMYMHMQAIYLIIQGKSFSNLSLSLLMSLIRKLNFLNYAKQQSNTEAKSSGRYSTATEAQKQII